MAPDRFQEQLRFISESMGGTPLVGGPPGEIPFYAYEGGHILCRAPEAHLVVDELNAAGAGRGGQVPLPAGQPTSSGLVRIPVAALGDTSTPDGGVVNSLRALENLEGRAGKAMAGKNHLVTITPGGVNSCPADEPEATTAAFHPALRDDPEEVAGDGQPPVTILVVDTGIVRDLHAQHPWMTGVAPAAGAADEVAPRRERDPGPGITLRPGVDPDIDLVLKLRPDPGTVPPWLSDRRPGPTHDAEGFVREYVGHGTFIAGLIMAIAPHTRVRVSNKMIHAGCLLEEAFVDQLLDALKPGWPTIISLSAGAANGRFTTLIGMERFMDALAAHPGTLLVAAAGNNGSDAPFWPAASAHYPSRNDGVVSVGALRVDGEEGACFSDHGEWVRVYAPGERLVGAFLGADVPQEYRYQHSTFERCRYLASFHDPFLYDCTCGFPARVGHLSGGDPADTAIFSGRARWSGTSFSTPIVAAMIADHMRRTGEQDPRAAARDLIEQEGTRATTRGVPVRALRPPGWNPVAVRRHPVV
ncbi:S8/S53 family peptidase [Sphaerisporangium aureirubrum]|uniref:S8/S53 family peptidase n=1 Tax=Sphaerisporangium aureirubrum TaxID=1544736 RepID=A0ABW1NMJ5_9ACTN